MDYTTYIAKLREHGILGDNYDIIALFRIGIQVFEFSNKEITCVENMARGEMTIIETFLLLSIEKRKFLTRLPGYVYRLVLICKNDWCGRWGVRCFLL